MPKATSAGISAGVISAYHDQVCTICLADHRCFQVFVNKASSEKRGVYLVDVWRREISWAHRAGNLIDSMHVLPDEGDATPHSNCQIAELHINT